jgi:copper transport protein
MHRGKSERRGIFQRLGVVCALLAASVACTLLLFPSPEASAHAALVRSNPANNEELIRPPIRATLFFSEGLERKLTKVEVSDLDGERVDDGDIRFDDSDPTFVSVGLPDLEPGGYWVDWSNVSTVDGHPYSGRYPFIILNADGSLPAGVDPANLSSSSGGTEALPKPLDAGLKWFAMISLAAVAGAAFFVAAVMRPAARFLDNEDRERIVDAGEQWLVNIAHVLLPASFIAASALVLVAVSRFDTSTSLMDYLTDIRTGQYRALLLGLLVVALIGTDLLFLSRGRAKRNAGIVLLVVATAGALLTYSMVSHGAADEGKFWSVLSDYVHLAASAIWLGMLIMLPPLLRTRTLGDGERRFLYQANAFDRFSIAAGISVIAILATGVFNSLVEIPTWSALRETTYGRVLLFKLFLVALLLPVAGLNAFILKPRLVRAIDATFGEPQRPPAGGSADDDLGWLERWLPRTIALEIVLVIAVFASVAVLTQTSTAEGEIAQEEAQRQASAVFKQTSEVDGLRLTLEVSPNLVGRNQYNLVVTDTEGTPYEAITQARLRFTPEIPGTALPSSELILNPFGPGEYRAEGAYFTQAGNWRIEARLRRSGADDVTRTYIDGVLAPARASADEGGAFALPFDSLNWNETAAAFLALGGVVLLLYRRELRGLAPYAGRATVSVAAVLLIGGAVLWFGFPDEHGGADLQAGNPVNPTEQSIERGRMLFQQNCVTCHGDDGRGDGPAAADLNPQPTDFRLHMPNHTDPDFFNFIADGYPGSAMPEFRDAFSDEDIWNLVNFLRASFSEAPTQ